MTPETIAILPDDKLIATLLRYYRENYTNNDSHVVRMLIDELIKRLFVSQLSVGLIMAMYHKVNQFSEFSLEGFKSSEELVGEYQDAIEQNGELIRSIYSGELNVYECMKKLNVQNINKNGKVIDPEENEP